MQTSVGTKLAALIAMSLAVKLVRLSRGISDLWDVCSFSCSVLVILIFIIFVHF